MASASINKDPPILVLVPHDNNFYRLRQITTENIGTPTQSFLLDDIRALSAKPAFTGLNVLHKMQRMFMMHRLVFGTAQVLGVSIC
jgi:hypothetical protein